MTLRRLRRPRGPIRPRHGRRTPVRGRRFATALRIPALVGPTLALLLLGWLTAPIRL